MKKIIVAAMVAVMLIDGGIYLYGSRPISQKELTDALTEAAHIALSDEYIEELTMTVEAETEAEIAGTRRLGSTATHWALDHLVNVSSEEELLAEVTAGLNKEWGEDWSGVPELYGLERAELVDFMLGKLKGRAAYIEYQAWMQVIASNPARPAGASNNPSYTPDEPLPIDDNGAIGNAWGTIDDPTPATQQPVTVILADGTERSVDQPADTWWNHILQWLGLDHLVTIAPKTEWSGPAN